MNYLKRIADDLLEERLRSSGAVLIDGPKWCGKTTTAKCHSASFIELQDPDMREAYMVTGDVRPSNLLVGDTPRLVDEWQDIPVLWDSVRTLVDRRGEPGQFILTGSNSVDDSKIMHSGTGRISRMRMLPMSLFESEESNGSVSLKWLFENPTEQIVGVTSAYTVNDLIYAACRGGWPGSLKLKNPEDRLRVAFDYVDGVAESDMRRVDGVERNPRLVRAVLRSYARNISTLATKSNILKDVMAMNEGCSDKTLDSYLAALRRLFVIEDLEAWSPAVRSASVIRRSPKREFIDPSIAVAAMSLSPSQLSVDLKTFGFIFETMCIRDLKVYSSAQGGTLSYYHDRYGLEADAVLHLRDGRYALIEIKLCKREVDMGADHLIEIRNLVRQYNEQEKQIMMREPDLLMVITGGPVAYTRADGVHVVPLSCLRD